MTGDVMSSYGLTAKQERFCEEYLIDLSGVQAALRAGYAMKSVNRTASRLLANPNVQACIDELKTARAKRVGITADQVLNELAIFAFSDVRHYRVDGECKLVLTENVPDKAARAVASFKRRVRIEHKRDITTIEVEIRLWSKPEALKMLGSHLELFTQRVKFPDLGETGVLVVPAGLDPTAWVEAATKQQRDLLRRGREIDQANRRGKRPAA